jgi:hypothetical protein
VIAFWGQLESTSFDNVWIFNNTLVDNETQFNLRNAPKPGALFVNNILLSLSSSAKDVDADGTLNGLSAKSNYFSRGNPGGGLSHADNVYSGLQLARMSGWRSIMSRDDVGWDDFLPLEGCSALGAGSDEVHSLALQEGGEFHMDYNKQPHNVPTDLGALRASSAPARVPKSPTEVKGSPQT